MKLYDVAFYLVYIATYTVIIPVGVGIYFFKTLSKTLKILLAGLCIVFLLDLLLLFFNYRATNTFLYLFTAVDVLTFAWIFNVSIKHKTVSKVILVIGFLFIPLIILDAFFLSGLKNKGLSNVLERIVVLIMAVYFLSQLFREDIESNLLKQPMFWVCVGVIGYNLVGSFDIFSGPILNYSQNLYLQYVMLWSIIIIFMHVSFAWSFWLCRSNADS